MRRDPETAARAASINRRISATVRRLRADGGVTQKQMAHALGVSFQQVQKYENGANRISAGSLVVIAQLLGRDIGDFFDADDIRVGLPRSRADLETVKAFARIQDPKRRVMARRIVRVLADGA